jgi:hypothetical protein
MKKFILLSAFFLCLAPILRGQYWIYDDLSEPKFDVSSTSLGTKVYIAGGDNGTSAVHDVEVYDIATEDWDTILSLSVGRSYPSCAAAGSKVFFAGGLDWYTSAVFSEVDIWDTELKMWDYQQLSLPRFSICAAAGGNKVLFAGGVNLVMNITYDVVDIYDISTGTWTVAHLSEPRSAMAHAVVGDLAFFAGGIVIETGEISNRVDIYRFSTGTWTTDSLSVGRCFLAGAAAGGKMLFAGGTTASDERTDIVDIYDTATGTWETSNLSVPRSFIYDNATTVCGNAYFVGGGDLTINGFYWTTIYDVIDIYDGDVNQWTVDNLTLPSINFTVAGIDNYLVKAGGQNPDPFSLVEIYIDDPQDCFVGIKPAQKKEAHINIYPNPSSGIIHLETDQEDPLGEMSVILYNLQGQPVHQQTLFNGDQEINLQLPNGVYVLKIRAGEMVQQELITIRK